ncbi:MAG: cytochrome c [Desulfobacterales bacterium]
MFTRYAHRPEHAGTLLFPIKMKLALAGILFFFLVLSMIFGLFGKSFSKILVALYLLCLICVIGLGYFGGELVYGTKAPASEISDGSAAAGAMVFSQNCSACHLTDSTAIKIGPGLKGVFNADTFPVSGWSVSDENFRKHLQMPFDKMPPFGHLQLDQVDALMAYLKTLWGGFWFRVQRGRWRKSSQIDQEKNSIKANVDLRMSN